jgi:opacity protein-like surface antigen
VDVDYAQTSEVSDLRDYSSADLGTELKYSVSERGELIFGIFVSDFESENEFSLNESQSFGGRLEYTYEFSEQFSAYAGVGYETIDTDRTSDGVTESDTDNAALYVAGVTREGEVSRTRLDVRQSVDPGGRGALQKRSQVRLRYTRQLSPRLFANLAARVQQTEETGEFGVDRDYQRYRAGLEWQFTQSWSIEGAYTYTAQDFSNQPTDADSNSFTISVIYEPPRRR